MTLVTMLPFRISGKEEFSLLEMQDKSCSKVELVSLMAMDLSIVSLYESLLGVRRLHSVTMCLATADTGMSLSPFSWTIRPGYGTGVYLQFQEMIKSASPVQRTQIIFG